MLKYKMHPRVTSLPKGVPPIHRPWAVDRPWTVCIVWTVVDRMRMRPAEPDFSMGSDSVPAGLCTGTG